jgi:[ribosomal protein S18]-alanine N-acetyltransferase
MARSGADIHTQALSSSITRMSEHDLLEVVEIEEMCGLSPWGWDSYHNEFSSGRDVVMLVAKNDGGSAASEGKRITGFIVSRIVADELHVNNVAIRPQNQRRGLATALLRSALDLGASQGAKVAFLEVRASNGAAQALYRRCGFRNAGRRRDYYRDPIEDALIMSVSLTSEA